MSGDVSEELVMLRSFLDEGLRGQEAEVAAELVDHIMASNSRGLLDNAKNVQYAPKPPIVTASYLLAKSFFDVKEFQRCAHALDSIVNSGSLSSSELDPDVEKTKQEEFIENGERTPVPNRRLSEIIDGLYNLYLGKNIDEYGIFLLALAYKENRQLSQARTFALEAATTNPFLWSAWILLVQLCPDADVVRSLSLPPHFMSAFFLAAVKLELQDVTGATAIYEMLAEYFEDALYIKSQLALCYYNSQNFEESENMFKDLLARDPNRLNGVSVYSNIMYIKESSSELSILAHKMSSVDKYSPETCVVIGNYYSLKGDHDKAVAYFKRALKLSSAFTVAWTLIGHEYIEMKQPSAAIEAYRRAVDANPKDFRAWYGLGQAYEIMEMFSYALYYYRRAQQCRPYDSRMWCAMAECYDLLGNPEEAIKCYKRAESNTDRDRDLALPKLGALYAKRGDADKAAYYYRLYIDRRDAQNLAPDAATFDAFFFLAGHAFDLRQYEDAEEYCTRVLDTTNEKDREAAKVLLKNIHSAMARDPKK